MLLRKSFNNGGADLSSLLGQRYGRKTFQGGTGDTSGGDPNEMDYTGRRRVDDPRNMQLGDGPFSQAINQMNTAFEGIGPMFAQSLAGAEGKKWAEDTMERLSEAGYSMDDLKNNKIPGHIISYAAKAHTTGGGANLAIREALKQNGIEGNDATQLLRSTYGYAKRMYDGDINVADMDNSMTELGYNSDDARFMGEAMSTLTGLHPETFDSKLYRHAAGGMDDDENSTGVAGATQRGSSMYGIPSAVEFRAASKRNMTRDGHFKRGSLTQSLRPNKVLVTGQEHRPDVDFAAQEFTDPVPQEEPTPQDVPQDVPDPMIPEETEITQTNEKRIIPGPQPVKKFPPEDIPPTEEPDPVPQGDPTPQRPGLGRFDLGMDTQMRSDYTGGADSSRATGPFANVQQQAGEGISAEELAEARRQMFQKTLGAKLNSMGRNYAMLNRAGRKYTMGAANPRGMRFIRRR